MPDYYSILGLKNGASKDEIRKAYRQLAMKWHPDKNPSAEAKQKFMQIHEAYDALLSGKTSSFASAFKKTTQTYKAKPKTSEEMRREKLMKNYENLRDRFLALRKKYNDPRFIEQKKKELYFDVKINFVLSGLILAGGIILPLVLSNGTLFFISIPIAIGFAMRIFFTAGRKKMRADMLFSKEEHYSISELRDFFDESPSVGVKMDIKRSHFGGY